jgi:uncharacterized Zn finger protein (UPF0148 family)
MLEMTCFDCGERWPESRGEVVCPFCGSHNINPIYDADEVDLWDDSADDDEGAWIDLLLEEEEADYG